MEKSHYDYRPSDWEVITSIGTKSLIVRFEIHEVEEGGFDCLEVTYNFKGDLSEDDYGKIVSAIIRGVYSEDDVEAILNNYLSDPEGHSEEFETLQLWRNEAKSTARQIIESVN